MLSYLLNSNGPQAGYLLHNCKLSSDITQLRLVFLTVVTLSRAGLCPGSDLTFVLDKDWEIKTNAIK